MSRRATSAPSHRADEPPPGRRARKRQENKLALSTLIARMVPGAVRECDVPVPPCSAFRLLSSLSYSHAWSFAVTKATQLCTRNRTSPVAVEESPPSRDPGTRPLRRSSRHPRLSLRRRCMSSCGAETHQFFSGHSAIDASDTRARAAPGVHVGQPASNAASKVSHEARRSSEKCVGSTHLMMMNYTKKNAHAVPLASAHQHQNPKENRPAIRESQVEGMPHPGLPNTKISSLGRGTPKNGRPIHSVLAGPS